MRSQFHAHGKAYPAAPQVASAEANRSLRSASDSPQAPHRALPSGDQQWPASLRHRRSAWSSPTRGLTPPTQKRCLGARPDQTKHRCATLGPKSLAALRHDAFEQPRAGARGPPLRGTGRDAFALDGVSESLHVFRAGLVAWHGLEGADQKEPPPTARRGCYLPGLDSPMDEVGARLSSREIRMTLCPMLIVAPPTAASYRSRHS
jgi:hypothetical protein